MTSEGFSCLFKGQARIAVFRNIDHTAMFKSKSGKNFLHGEIVSMGVDPQVTALFVCPANAIFPCATAFPGSDAMHHAIGGVTAPCAVVDHPVAGIDIRTKVKVEDRVDQSVFCADMAFFCFNIPAY